jgi:large subunit ribosomal protein L21
MFAIIKTGGKQYRVQQNTVLRIEKLTQDVNSKVTFDEVLLVSNGGKVTVGTPTVKGAKVEAEIINQMRDRKVIIFKKKRRHNYRRKNGHRQHLTVVKIQSISC